MAAERTDVTGLVLAGGRGSRMGGADKGLLDYRGEPLALHALRRLAPQAGALMISANRHLERYRALAPGVPVWPDTIEGFPGPLAGLLAGLEHATTPWIAAVPCDVPELPADLVARLAAAAAQGADIAYATTRDPEAAGLRAHPVCCLLRRELAAPLRAGLLAGQRKVMQWMAQQHAAAVVFDDAAAFANLNTADAWRRLDQS